MDLQGDILSVDSFKEISRSEIINHIIGFGKAVLISTDVHPPPKMVKKLATSLNAKLDHPDKDMSVGLKMELVESYLTWKYPMERSKVISSKIVPQDAHQRDALAASIRTYKDYQKKFKLIESRSLKINLSPEKIDLAKKMVIDGTAISSAIRIIQEMDEEENIPPEIELEEDELEPSADADTTLKLKNKIRMQDNQIKNLINKNLNLEEKIGEYDRKITKLQDKIEKLHYEYTQDILEQKELLSKISLIKKLQNKYNHEKALRIETEKNLNALQNIQLVNPENAIPVKIIETFTKDGITGACEYWKIKKDDVVLLKSSEGGGSQTANLLIKMGVKAVIIRDKISHNAQEEFEKNMVPLLNADAMDLKMIDQFAIINTLKLEEEINRWNEEIENEMIKQSNQEILNVFDEYRARRKRNIDND